MGVPIDNPQRNKTFDIASTAGNAVSGIAGQALGMALGGWQDRRQVKQQRRLQELQMKGQKEMADYQQQLQLQMWEKTNAKSQVGQLKEAGLNPALMYGMSGGGAATTGGGIATGVSSGNATDPSAATGMGIQMASQLALLTAQKENIEANTEKTKVETVKTSGVDTDKGRAEITKIGEEIKAIGVGIENTKAQQYYTEARTYGQEIENYVNGVAKEMSLEQIKQNLKLAIINVRKAGVEADVAEATEQDQIKILARTAIGAALKNELTKTQTDKTESDRKMGIKQTTEAIMQKWAEIEQTGQRDIKQGIKEAGEGLMDDVVNVIQTIILMSATKGKIK